MVTSQEALEIARIYAEQNGRGWDERYFEVSETIIDGEPLWMVSTSHAKSKVCRCGHPTP